MASSVVLLQASAHTTASALASIIVWMLSFPLALLLEVSTANPRPPLPLTDLRSTHASESAVLVHVPRLHRTSLRLALRPRDFSRMLHGMWSWRGTTCEDLRYSQFLLRRLSSSLL